jgi:fatty-acyl-CoA synthase
VIRLGAEQPRHAQLRRPAARPARRAGRAGRTGRAPAVRRPDQHPVHLGTTGNPKGATLSHHNILNNGFFVGEAIRLRGATGCIPVPLYHCFGMVMGNLGCLTHGATMVYPAEASSRWPLQAVAEERCTACTACPPCSSPSSTTRLRGFDLSSLRTGIMAGSPCPIEVMKRVIDEMHMGEVTIAYGMTETPGELPERHRRPWSACPPWAACSRTGGEDRRRRPHRARGSPASCAPAAIR